jgi:hypothetical protein
VYIRASAALEDHPMGSTTAQNPTPETDDELRTRVPRAQGESDQAYIARLDAARAETVETETETVELDETNA